MPVRSAAEQNNGQLDWPPTVTAAKTILGGGGGGGGGGLARCCKSAKEEQEGEEESSALTSIPYSGRRGHVCMYVGQEAGPSYPRTDMTHLPFSASLPFFLFFSPFFTPELPLRTVNCSRHEDAPRSLTEARRQEEGGSERAREMQTCPTRRTCDAAVVKMISRNWQRLRWRCSFHRRLAE